MSNPSVRSHLPAFVIVLIVIVVGVLLLPSLPEEVPIHYDRAGNPDASGPATLVVTLFSASMLGMFIFMLISDIFLVYPVLPGKMMAAINAVIAATMSVVYGTALAMDLGKIENMNTGLVLGFLIIIAVCLFLYFAAARRLDESVSALGSVEYFEKTSPSWFYYLFIFAIPLIPRYLLLSDRGIGILGVLYRITIPWYDVDSVTAMDLTTGGKKAGLPVKIYHTFTNLVLVRITGKKASIIISPREREKYLRIAGDYVSGKPPA
ncbi:MAG: DUF1648 domain-containing protein [Deltaproteobacteria bacterium]|nr:DUF1648 domain-containing protein [Candidatus Zymogenaceae bacterium]